MIGLDIDLYWRKYICMKTTLNLPDEVARDAKLLAVAEDTTLTDLIVQGLKAQLRKSNRSGSLPVSNAGGGLRPGVAWDDLLAADAGDDGYR